MIKMNGIQYRWLQWLLLNGYTLEWLKGYIEAPENYQRLRKAYMNKEYDIPTRALLNFLLKKFNGDEGMKQKWKAKLEWETKYPIMGNNL